MSEVTPSDSLSFKEKKKEFRVAFRVKKPYYSRAHYKKALVGNY